MLGGQRQGHVEVGGLEDPEPGQVLLRLHERTIGEDGLAPPVVDDGSVDGCAETAGEDPVALGLQALVEDVDSGRLGSAVARPGSWSSITETRYCISHHLLRSGRPVWVAIHPYYERHQPDRTPRPDVIHAVSSSRSMCSAMTTVRCRTSAREPGRLILRSMRRSGRTAHR